jgi:hypothetical protein
MEINISEYLSHDEIKDIVTDELRNQIRNHFNGEQESERLLSNLAHEFVFNEIEKISPNYKSQVIEKVESILSKDLTFYIFRNHYSTNAPQSFASKLIDQTVKENIELFKSKIISDILAKDYTEDSLCKFQNLAENFTSNIYDFIDAIRDRKESQTSKQ